MLLWALSACAGEGKRPQQSVSLAAVASFPLTVNEPSGLALDIDGATLWAVGNSPSRVYRLTLEGTTLATLSYQGGDLEGIAVDPDDGTLWVLEERTRNLVHLSRSGRLQSSTRLDLGGAANSGPEGISFSPTRTIWVVQEKHPGQLVRLSESRAIAATIPLAFARDYSDLCWDAGGQWLWVLSDEDRALFRCAPDGTRLAGYGIDVVKPEGVAVDPGRGRIYVTSDAADRLYAFEMPSLEAAARGVSPTR
jgi:uncharacterized protein YjiK